MPRNYDSKLHPFEAAREYQRALNAVKLEKLFAKPFLGSLDGHADVVQTLMKHPTKLPVIVSGACDGEIKIWNLATRKCVKTYKASDSIIRSLCAPQHGRYFFSVDDNKNIKQWSFDCLNERNDDDDDDEDNEQMNTIVAKSLIMGMDHHFKKPMFMTCGETVDLWEETRVEPLKSYQWGVDTVYCVKFNPVQTDICIGSASDRSLILYDTRKSDPLRKIVMEMRNNMICWNPLEAFNFTAANENHE